MLDLQDFGLEGFKQVCCTYVTREFIPLANSAGKERELSVILVVILGSNVTPLVGRAYNQEISWNYQVVM